MMTLLIASILMATGAAADNTALLEWGTAGGAATGGVSMLTIAVHVWKYLKGLSEENRLAREENKKTREEIKTNRDESESRHTQSMSSHNDIRKDVSTLMTDIGTVNTTVESLKEKVESLEGTVDRVDKTTIEIQGELKVGAQRMATLEKGVHGNSERLTKHSASINKNVVSIAKLEK